MHTYTQATQCVLHCDFKSNHMSMKNRLNTLKTSLKNVNIFKPTDPTFLSKWCFLEGGFYSNCQRDSVVLMWRCCTCCPRRSWALREIRFLPQGAILILPPNPPPQTLCCWHSHANSSPLVITLSLNQLTTTAGVRLLTAHCWMGGGMQANVCVCTYMYLLMELLFGLSFSSIKW